MQSFKNFLVEQKENSICMNVPLFIRLLEYAREDVKQDIVLHKITENILALHKKGRTCLKIEDYKTIVR